MTSDSLLLASTILLLMVLVWIVLFASRRLHKLESKTIPGTAAWLPDGPHEGSIPAAVSVRRLDGEWETVGGPRPKPQLVLFFYPKCPNCEMIPDSLRTLQRYWKHEIDLLLVSDDPPGELLEALNRMGLSGFPSASSPLLFESWKVRVSPFAVLLNERGTVHSKGITNSLESLEYLVDLGVNMRKMLPKVGRPSALSAGQ